MNISCKKLQHGPKRDESLPKPVPKQVSIVLAHTDLAGKLLDCSAALPESAKSSLHIKDYLALSQSDFDDLLSDLDAAGGSLEVQMGCSPHSPHGKSAHNVAVFRDSTRLTWVIAPLDNCQISRTELARERDKLRMILDHAPIGIWLQDGAGKPEFVNPAFCKGIGITEQQFLAVDHYQEIIPEEYRATCLASDAKALAADGPTVAHLQLPFADGQIHDLKVISAIKRNDDGSPRHLIGLAMDITDRIKKEAALNEAKAQLIKLGIESDRRRLQERRQIAQALHDDLGQLLTAASLGLDCVVKLEPAYAKVLGQISNIRELISEAIKTTREVTAALRPPVALEHGLALAIYMLITRLNDSTPTIIDTDIDDLSFSSTPEGEQITLTLYRFVQEGLTNALRHAHAKTIRIEIKGSEGEIRANLTDDGKGFDSTSLKFSSGLGLQGLSERAELLGGKFSIESNPDQGTRMLLKFPAEYLIGGMK